MAIKKSDRQKVYEKYNGHCAYCGKEISLKDMQVDHIDPLRNWDKSKTNEELNSIKNFNPACRRCNHYKRADNLESFRETMKTLHERISKIYIAKVGIDYGIVNIKPFDGKFYFEKITSKPVEILAQEYEICFDGKQWVAVEKFPDDGTFLARMEFNGYGDTPEAALKNITESHAEFDKCLRDI